jgi:TonB family protein
MKLLAIAVALALPSTAFAGPKLAEQPTLRSADRIAPWIRDRVGMTAKADLQVCAATDGHVTSVKIVRGSGYDAFDRAVMTDVRDWQYTADSIPRCTLVKISYLADH